MTAIKQIIFGMTALYLALFLCFPADALTYVDNMSDLSNNTIKQYSNFIPMASSSIPPAVQNVIAGKNAFTFANASRPLAHADYRVHGADTVTVGIYTQKGTFVSYVDADSAYALGVYQNNITAALSGKALYQAQISLSDYSLYYRSGSQFYKVRDSGGYFAFLPTADSVSGLIDYGLNIYAGASAAQLSRVSLPTGDSQGRIFKMNADWTSSYCYEELTYTLPAGTAYVRVEINDYAYIDKVYPNGQMVQVPPVTGMRSILSSVAFTGSSLVLGIPEPALEESSSGASSSSPGTSLEKSASSRRSDSSSTAQVSAAASTSSSKFEGEILSSVSGERTTRAGSSASSSEASAPSSDAPSPPEFPSESSLLQVYRVESGNKGGGSTGIAIYIVVVCVLVLILLLRGKGQ